MSNPNPGLGGSDTLIVQGPASAAITLTAHYKTTNSTYSGTTDSSGRGSVTFGIGRPTAGYTVNVTVSVGGASCATSFTPS